MAYDNSFLLDIDLVIAATNNHEVNKQIYRDARTSNLLVNVADTPQFCDFYLGEHHAKHTNSYYKQYPIKSYKSNP